MKINAFNITTKHVRSRLRNGYYRNDAAFIDFAISQNIMSEAYFNVYPYDFKRALPKQATVKYGIEKLNSICIQNRYKEDIGKLSILPDTRYTSKFSDVNAGTLLGPGIPLSKFVNAPGTRATLNHISSSSERQQLARQFYCHVPLILGFRENKGRFGKHTLAVTEGLAKLDENESYTPNAIRDLATKGRIVVYEVQDAAGNNDPSKTFELAMYWKDNHLFQQMILHYDTVDPKVPVNAEIIMIMPKVNNFFEGVFDRNVRTEYNFRTLVEDGIGQFSL